MSFLDNQQARAPVLTPHPVGNDEISTLPVLVDASAVSGKRTIPDLKKLKPIHLQIIDSHLRGYNHTEIMQQVEVSMYTVHRVLRDPLAAPYLLHNRELAEMEFATLRRSANNAVGNALQSKDNRTALAGARLFYEVSGDMASKEADSGLSAEDVVAAIINQVNIQVNVNTKG